MEHIWEKPQFQIHTKQQTCLFNKLEYCSKVAVKFVVITGSLLIWSVCGVLKLSCRIAGTLAGWHQPWRVRLLCVAELPRRLGRRRKDWAEEELNKQGRTVFTPC